MPAQQGLRLDEIVSRLGGELDGDGSVVVSQVAPLASAQAGQISFITSQKYKQQLLDTLASAVIVPPEFAGEISIPTVIHRNPYAYYARVVALLNPESPRTRGVHSSAVLNSSIPVSASIGENSVIGAGSVVTKDIPANVVAVGNPCRVLRDISEKDLTVYHKESLIDIE